MTVACLNGGKDRPYFFTKFIWSDQPNFGIVYLSSSITRSSLESSQIIMRKFFIAVLSSIFFLIAPLAVYLVVFYQLFSTPDLIKQSLNQANAYPIFADSLTSLLAEQFKTAPQLKPVVDAFKQELTGDYLKSKFETYIDQTYSLLQGRSTVSPTFSLADLKSRLQSRTKLISRLPPESLKAFENEFKLNPEQVKPLQMGYDNLRIASLVGAAFSLLVLLLIFALGKNLNHRLRLVAKSLLSVGISNLIGVGLFALLLPQVRNFKLPNIPESLSALNTAVGSLLVFMFGKVIFYLAIPFAIMFVLGLVLILVFKKQSQTVS